MYMNLKQTSVIKFEITTIWNNATITLQHMIYKKVILHVNNATITLQHMIYKKVILHIYEPRPSWSWSYGSWIYNYPCNQCLSPQTLWVRIPIRRGVLDTTLCDKVCQSLVAGRWFSLCTPVSFTNKTDSYDIAEILLKVALSIITITPVYVPLLLPNTDHVSKLKIMSEIAHDYWKWLIYWQVS